MTRECALCEQGWEMRGTYDEPRLSELIQLYEQIGFTVRLEPLDPLQDRGCTDCMRAAPEKYTVLYTRKKTAD